ncbi:MAG: TonB-dependent receptor [Tannerella sp.]|nr:TonB-dependent receptor [Tannerella sp.]
MAKRTKGRICILKISLFLICFSSLHLFAADAYSQLTRLTLHMNQVEIKDVLMQIEDQSEFYFLYNGKLVDVDKTVSVSADNRPITDVLAQLFDSKDVVYTVVDRQIVLMPASSRDDLNVLPATKQQDNPISGTVRDESNEPLIGVNVQVKGTTIGTITDIDGKFSLSVSGSQSILVFSYVGYLTQEITVSTQRTMNVVMREDSQSLDEVVVTGYSTQRKRDLTGAVAVVKMNEIENIPSSNIMQTLQGQVPGLFITSTGSPTGDATVRVRGVSTLSNSDPLYIIDGIPTVGDMNNIASEDIESIQVLKDASSASIYGSRAANGVIIVTTKKADRSATSSISFRSSMTVNTYTQKPLEWLNTYDRGWAQWRASRNDGVEPTSWPYIYTDHQEANGNWVLDRIDYPEWIDADRPTGPTMRPADTDWVKEVLQTAITQSYNVTASTGSSKGRALLSLDYLDNVGAVKGTYNNRMSIRINSDYTLIKDRLNIGENIMISHTKRSSLNQGSLFSRTQQIQPIIPIHTDDGIGWGGAYGAMDDNGQNPLRIIEQNKDNYENMLRLMGNVYLDLEIIKNLHARTNISLNQGFEYSRIMTLPFSDGALVDDLSRVQNEANRTGSLTWTNTLSYMLEFGYHHIDINLGHEQINTSLEYQQYMRDGYDLYDPEYMYIFAGESSIILGAATDNDPSPNRASQSRLLSYFGRANYVYRDKYLASFTLRRDGSSKFGANHRFATFPAFSLAWRLSEEGFFKKNLPVVSDLKLRYGWGQTGNERGIDDFAAQGLYQSLYQSQNAGVSGNDDGTSYDITGAGSGTKPMGFRRMQMENVLLKWETITENNIGIDFGFMNQKLTGSVDYFFKKATDILVTPPSLGVLGEGSNRTVNGASMENQGFEFIAQYRDRIGDLSYNVSANLSRYRNKVTELPTTVLTQYAGNGVDKIILGRSRSSVFGYYADGLFKTQEEVDAYINQSGKGIGRIIYRDISGPGATPGNTPPPDGSITTADRDYIGKTDPDFIYGISIGLRYKQWDFSMFWNGEAGKFSDAGRAVKLNSQFIGAAGHMGQNYGKQTLDAWSPENPNSKIPALSLNDVNLEGSTRANSTYFLENVSYFKLRNMEFGYTIPTSLSNKILIQNARVYLLGRNLLKFYKKSGDQAFTGADPETPGNAYPIPLSITIGLNVTF